MTGAVDLYNSAIGHACFASSRAPRGASSFIFGFLGAACSLAFEVGAKHRSMAFNQVQQSAPPPRSTNFPLTTSKIQSITGVVVVIPVLAKAERDIERVQQAVYAVGTDATVIVVDDGSPKKLHGALRDCLVVSHMETKGPAAARNTGTKLALALGASSIAYTDSDCLPEPGWAKFHAELQEDQPGIWAGKTVAAGKDLVSDFHNRVGTLMPRLRTISSSDALYAPACNISVSRQVAESVGFDPAFPTSAFEDVDFCLRARLEYKWNIRISDKPVIRHDFQPGIFGLLGAYHKYGRSYPLLLRRYPEYPQALAQSMPMNAATQPPRFDVPVASHGS